MGEEGMKKGGWLRGRGGRRENVNRERERIVKGKDAERKGEGKNVYTHTKSTLQNVPLRIISNRIYCHHHQSRRHR